VRQKGAITAGSGNIGFSSLLSGGQPYAIESSEKVFLDLRIDQHKRG
jgi:hypothetical protein